MSTSSSWTPRVGHGPPPSTNSSPVPLYLVCQNSMASTVIFSLYTLFNLLLLLPLYILVLYLGLKRWWHQRSVPARTSMSHSDFFTFNMLIVELSGVLGSAVFTAANFLRSEAMLFIGLILFSMTVAGQTLFHVLTCVERYLCAVHPVTYVNLRETLGVRVRNVATACVWLACFSWCWSVQIFNYNLSTYPLVVLLGTCTGVTLFCCVSVLRVLTDPGPGDMSKDNKSKQRALHIIGAITSALLLRFAWLLTTFSLENLVSANPNVVCPVLDSGIWLTVPSSLILPLLFLNKAGSGSCCRP